MKRCEVCGKAKPEEEFSKSYRNRCKGCVSNMARFKRNSVINALELKKIYETPDPAVDAIVKELSSQTVEYDLIDWEQRRFELAKDAMNGRLAIDDNWDKESLCRWCIGIADEMIKQLKGESDEK